MILQRKIPDVSYLKNVCYYNFNYPSLYPDRVVSVSHFLYYPHSFHSTIGKSLYKIHFKKFWYIVHPEKVGESSQNRTFLSNSLTKHNVSTHTTIYTFFIVLFNSTYHPGHHEKKTPEMISAVNSGVVFVRRKNNSA